MFEVSDMLGNDIMDKEVIGANGWKLGKSKDVIVTEQSGANTWAITHLDVELKGNIEDEIGLYGAPLAHNRLPIPISHVQGVGDVITLRTTKEEVLQSLKDSARTLGVTTAATNNQRPPAFPPAV